MRVIRHHAPREQPVALSIEMPNDVRHNFCDSPVAHIASAQPVVQPRLAFSQDGPRFPKTRAIRSQIRPRPRAPYKRLAFLAKPGEQLARKRIGQPEGHKVNRIIVLPVR